MEELLVALISKLVIDQTLEEVFKECFVLSVVFVALNEALGVIMDWDLVAVYKQVAIWILSLLEALDLVKGLDSAVFVIESAIQAFIVHDAEAFTVHELHSGRCLGQLIEVGRRTLQVGCI